MSNAIKTTTYKRFGMLLASLRTKAGIAKQSELANRLGIRQQTVSRWERGLSRPRHKEVQRLASVLNTDQETLLEAAGYAHAAVAATFERPFPINALPPESFERFCHYFLERLYRHRGGRVHRAGSSGHQQDGIDVSVTGSFGTHTFQCKRVEEFGPQRVLAAIDKHTAPATQKFLLLSNIASPQSRAALAGHLGWEIWDREDISLRVRSLPKIDQLDLVDTFFRGKRLELLGEGESGPWMTDDKFFGPFLESTRLFNHAWRLVGRTNEAAALDAAMLDDSVAVTMLVAPAGGGKTRLLRHAVEKIDPVETGRRIWFLSPTEDVTATHLDQLGASKKLLVVDDAHDRDDLGVLFHYCASSANQARLLLSLRPYGSESLKYQAASLSLSGPTVREIVLTRPTRSDAEALAAEVLAKCNGPVNAAHEIAMVTSDNPLATVIGAQIVAREMIHPTLLGNVDDFQTQILAAVQNVIAGEIVTGLDVDRMQAVLRIVALVQPILPDEPALLDLLKNVERLDEQHSGRLLRILIDAGVLFRRGLRYRLSPDLLADAIVVRHCTNLDGSSNGYVERVFDLAHPAHVKNLLSNLGKLDWRRRFGKAEESRLLEGVWNKLRWHGEYSNPHLDAAAAVAHYQPRMALRFARTLIDQGHGGDARVGQMLKNAAYNLECLEEACELLWLASRSDQRPVRQEPHHGIRILKELAQYEPNKPIQYMEKVVEFALALVDTPDALTGAHTPFEILEGALAAEGHSTVAANRRSITLTGYAADRQVVVHIRERVISHLISCIEQGSERRAFLAAKTLADALRSPMGILGAQVSLEVSQDWREEHERTIDRLSQLLDRVRVHPVVLVRAAESVARQAFHGSENEGANAVLALLDRDLETRLVRALMDGWGTNTWPLDHQASDPRQPYQNHLSKLKVDLSDAFEAPSNLHDFVEKCLVQVSEIAGPDDGAPRVVVDFLIEAIPRLATEILARHGSDQPSPLRAHTGAALGILLKNPETSRESLRVLAETSTEGQRLVAEAYARLEPTEGYTETDVSLLRTMFCSKDPTVLHYASRAARQIAGRDKALAVNLVCSVDLIAAGRAVHDLFMWLSHRDTIPRECINDDQWRQLLANLEPVQELDDYWIQQFLKDVLQVMPDAVIHFLKNRLQRLEGTENWSYSPLTKPYREGESLGLLKLADSERHLRSLLDWALDRSDDSVIPRRFGDVVAGLCGDYDRALLCCLLQWMTGGSDRHARVVAAVLAEAQSDVIFDHPELVRNLLAAAHGITQDAVRRISSSLHMATSSGVRSTTPGEPFPEDVRLEKHASDVLSTLSRWDPAYGLYSGLLRSAKSGIEWQRREKEAMDAEDDE
jgi:transcriptional regulator with XRE-family HTH domain